MTGGSIFVTLAVHLVLTAAPGVAAVLLALRFRVRDEAVLLCTGLAGTGVAAMLTFWVYWLAPGGGALCAYAILFGSIAIAIWCRAQIGANRELLRRLGVPLALWALGSSFLVFFGFLHGGGQEAVTTATNRFSTRPSPFASDSSIPSFFSDWMYAGHPGAKPPIFPPGWLFSDRPPLQVAYVLTQRAFGWDTTTYIDYQVLGVILQQLWIIAMWALLTAAKVSARTRALAICAALLSDVAIVNGFYVWPKLLGSAFVVASLALVVAPGKSPLRRRPLTFALLGALAALAYLSHGTAVFGLIPVAIVAAWRGLPKPRYLAAGAAALLLLVIPWTAFQHYVDPPGNRLMKWSLAGVAEIDDRGVLATLGDSYGEAGVGGTVDNKLQNFLTMAGGNPVTGSPQPGQVPFGPVTTEIGDAVGALADGDLVEADSKIREIRQWHLLWTLGLLILALPVIALGRLRGAWRDGLDWRFARLCLVVCGVGALAWGLLMFGSIAGRAIVSQGSLAFPLIGVVGVVAGLRATYPRLAPWFVGAAVLTNLLVYLPTIAPTSVGTYDGFAEVATILSLAGFVAVAAWQSSDRTGGLDDAGTDVD